MLIRKATVDEIDDILKVYEDARQFMVDNGNSSQWKDGYPTEDLLREDIAAGKLYVCENGPMLFQWSDLTAPANDMVGGTDGEAAIEALEKLQADQEALSGIFGVFYFAIEDDPTYHEIDGAWIADGDYGVVHRIAVARHGKGVGQYCLEWAQAKVKQAGAAGGLRIDTHRDNAPMRKLLTKMWFTECGEIICCDGTPRLAYQFVE